MLCTVLRTKVRVQLGDFLNDSNSNSTFISGQNATITCVVSPATPRARVRWFRHDSDSALTFTSGDFEDAAANADAVVIEPQSPPTSSQPPKMDLVSAATEILNNSVSRRGEQRFVIYDERVNNHNNNYLIDGARGGGDARVSRCVDNTFNIYLHLLMT